MSTPAMNTKLERACEAVENLAVAVCSAHLNPLENFKNVTDARQELREALSDFLQPALRIAGGTDFEPPRRSPSLPHAASSR